jgi:hypothetical protein
MKHLASISPLLALVLLCGCGGGGYRGATGGAGGATSPPPSTGSNVISNWQFSTTSTVPGTPPLTIAGSINQSSGSISGAVHVDGSNCFDRPTTIALTGSLTGDTISLTFASVAGQVTTLTGSLTDNALTDAFSAGQFIGTYAINGGCANGDQGNVTGIKVPYIANILNATFTASGGETFDVTGNMSQYSGAGPEGSFGITGTATFGGSCFSLGTITPGAFPSGSFIMGTSVALKIETSNGTVDFVGTQNMANGQITGDYTVSGGTCVQSGKAILFGTSPWDY